MKKSPLFLLLLLSSLCIAKGTLYDPLHLLEMSDEFLKTKPFENAFSTKQYSVFITREVPTAQSEILQKEVFEVREISEHKVKYVYKYWWKNSSDPKQWEECLDRNEYESHKGNRLREIVQSLLDWGDSVNIESATRVTVKVGKEKIPGLEVRFKDITPESPAGYALFRIVLVRRHYFAQVALQEVYVPFPGYKIVQVSLEQYAE